MASRRISLLFARSLLLGSLSLSRRVSHSQDVGLLATDAAGTRGFGAGSHRIASHGGVATIAVSRADYHHDDDILVIIPIGVVSLGQHQRCYAQEAQVQGRQATENERSRCSDASR